MLRRPISSNQKELTMDNKSGTSTLVTTARFVDIFAGSRQLLKHHPPKTAPHFIDKTFNMI